MYNDFQILFNFYSPKHNQPCLSLGEQLVPYGTRKKPTVQTTNYPMHLLCNISLIIFIDLPCFCLPFSKKSFSYDFQSFLTPLYITVASYLDVFSILDGKLSLLELCYVELCFSSNNELNQFILNFDSQFLISIYYTFTLVSCYNFFLSSSLLVFFRNLKDILLRKTTGMHSFLEPFLSHHIYV